MTTTTTTDNHHHNHHNRNPRRNPRKQSICAILDSGDTEPVTQARQYLQSLTLKNYAPLTISRHRYGVCFFLQWAQERGITALAAVTRAVIAHYETSLREMTERVACPLSVRQRWDFLYILAAFFRYLVKTGQLAATPCDKIALPKLPRRLPCHVLSHKEVEAIIAQADVDKAIGLRDRAMLELMYSTGIRRQEVAGLAVADVDVQSGLVYVRHGKGDKQRVVPLGERAILWLSKYLLQVRSHLTKGRPEAQLFVTYKGTGFTISGLANLVVAYVRAAGKGGCCHIFRHAMATAMLENGADIRHIQEILGHELLSSTQIYTHVAMNQLREVYEQTQPAPLQDSQNSGDAPPAAAKPMRKWGGQPYSQKTARGAEPQPVTTELARSVSDYLQAMHNKAFSDQTIAKQRQHLHRFVTWCEERAITRLSELGQAVFTKYHKHLWGAGHKEQPLAASYIGRHLLSLRAFLKWLASAELVPAALAQNIELPKSPQQLPMDTLTNAELAQVLAQPDLTDPLGLRDRAILELLAATGIRRQELCLLDLGDINLSALTLHIRHGKGGIERLIPLSQRAGDWLDRYLSEVRPRLCREDGEPALFLGRYGPRINIVTLGELVKRYLRQAQITKPGSCHIFRHTLATQMLENGADIRYIQQMLGHSNLTSTQVYTKVSIRKLKDVHEQTHPAGKLRGPASAQ